MTKDPQARLVQPGAALAPAAELAGRIAGLQAGLAALGLDAALLQQNADLFYFAGTVQQSYLYVPAEGEATLFVRKVAERARLESALGAIVELPSPKDLPRLIAERYGALPARLGLELDVLPVAHFRRLEKLLPGAAFEDVGRSDRAPAGGQVGLGGRAHPRVGGRGRRGQPASSPASSRRGSPRWSSPAGWRRRRAGWATRATSACAGSTRRCSTGSCSPA